MYVHVDNIYIYIYIYMCIHVYIYIYIYRDIDRYTCKPNTGEEGGIVASARWSEGQGRGMAKQGGRTDLAMSSSSQIKLITFKNGPATKGYQSVT